VVESRPECKEIDVDDYFPQSVCNDELQSKAQIFWICSLSCAERVQDCTVHVRFHWSVLFGKGFRGPMTSEKRVRNRVRFNEQNAYDARNANPGVRTSIFLDKACFKYISCRQDVPRPHVSCIAL
jgi:hypothetical protein